MNNEMTLMIVNGAGVVLWFFVVTLIRDLKEGTKETLKSLIEIEKTVVEIRTKLSNTDREIESLWEEIRLIKKELK